MKPVNKPHISEDTNSLLESLTRRITRLESELEFVSSENGRLRRAVEGANSSLQLPFTREAQNSQEFMNILASYVDFFEEIQFGIAICDVAGNMVVNKTFATMMGYSAEELHNLSFLDITHPGDREESTMLSLKMRTEGMQKFSLEKRYICKDGSLFHSSTKVMGVFDPESKNLLYSFATIEDISERKFAERALKKAATGLADASGDSVFESLVQSLAEITECDFALIAEVLSDGITIETLALYADGKLVKNISYLAEIAPCLLVLEGNVVIVQDSLQNDYPEDTFCANNNIVSYAGAPLIGSGGSPNGVIAVMHRQKISDIERVKTMFNIFADRASAEIERRQSIIALRQSEERYRYLFDSSPISFWEFDVTDLVKWIRSQPEKNEGYFRTVLNLGNARENVLERMKLLNVNNSTVVLLEAGSQENLINNLAEIHTNNSMPGLMALGFALARGVYKSEGENSYTTLKGNTIHVHGNWVVDRVESGEYRLILSFVDITKRKIIECAMENLVNATKNESEDVLYRTIVKDILDVVEADCAFVGKFVSDPPELELLAVFSDSNYLTTSCNIDERTPYKQILSGSDYELYGKAAEEFPNFELFKDVGAKSYLGLPLKDSQGRILGVLAVMSKKPEKNFKAHINLLRVFASRCATEMERRIAEKALRESEEAHRTIFNTTPASIVEYDMLLVWPWIKELRSRDITDVETYLRNRPEDVLEQIVKFQPTKVNDETLLIAQAKDRKELLDHYADFFKYDYLETGVAVFSSLYNGARKGKLTISIRNLTKEKIDLLVHWGLYGGESGEQYILAACVDITEQRKAQQALKLSEHRYRTIFEATPVAFCEFDYSQVCTWFEEIRQAGVKSISDYLVDNPEEVNTVLNRLELIAVNEETLRITGVVQTEDTRSQLWSTFKPSTRFQMAQAFDVFFNGEDSYECEAIFQSLRGRDFYMLLRLKIIASDGEEARLLVSGVDITDRKRSEQMLQHSEAQLRKIFESSPIGFMRHDITILRQLCDGLREDGIEDIEAYLRNDLDSFYSAMRGMKLEEINSEAGRILGEQSLAELMPQVGRLFLPHSQDQFIDSLVAFYTGKKTFRFEARAKTKKNIDKHLILQWTVFDFDTEQPFIVTGMVDITDYKLSEENRRDMERQLQHVQKLESLGVMAGGIAHDFNNLLTGIMGNAELLQMDFPPNSVEHQYAAEIVEISTKAGELCNQMLAYSGRGSYTTEYFDLNDEIRDMYPLLKAFLSQKANLTLDLQPGLPQIQADRSQIKQVILNLLSNADEAITTNGIKSVTLTTKDYYCDGVFAKSLYFSPGLQSGNYVKISVVDQGCGMSAETVKRIFDPFFSTRFTGRGLGLPTVLGIVRSHNGGVAVESSVECGSTFHILLPVGDQKLLDQQAINFTDPDWQGSGRVLVVDDETIVRNLLSRLLNKRGFKVSTANSGEEGVEIFSKSPAEFVLAIVDMTMPGIDGLETFRRLKAIQPNVKVIVCSGYTKQRLLGHPKAAGLAAYIKKPFNIMELTETVREILSK